VLKNWGKKVCYQKNGKIKMIKQKPKKYGDKPVHEHIVREYENELKRGYDKMLVKMSKEFGQKLNEILK
jgi:hypothetical protein